ncbi:Protein FAR1-RELATED SEQUENCE 11 [Striga hermonthica]|uniref:Protein FAR1-RELATED SEQUENCE 11 n=1 Tax=Striga hermonthica TaxID=68872 RepID=A0A9N7R5R6_STRHE|nr:Protein FAR1-RELATED SEQUENCE 11 [Striga hermonthica]
MNGGPSGFNNAPVTRVVVIASILFTVVFGIQDGGVDLSGKMETELSEWANRHFHIVKAEEDLDEGEFYELVLENYTKQIQSVTRIRYIAHECLRDHAGSSALLLTNSEDKIGKKSRGKERVRRRTTGKRRRKEDLDDLYTPRFHTQSHLYPLASNHNDGGEEQVYHVGPEVDRAKLCVVKSTGYDDSECGHGVEEVDEDGLSHGSPENACDSGCGVNTLIVGMDVEQDETSLVPKVTIGATPKVGQVFQSLEEAYNFYNNYAKQAGFSVRIANNKKSKETNEEVWKMYSCNKEGKTDETWQTKKKKIATESRGRKRGHTRCGCQAKMSVKKSQDDGMWIVSCFIEQHNHPLTTPNKVHLLPSHRIVSTTKKALVQQFSEANIPISQQVMLLPVAADKYILPRWTKKVKSSVTCEVAPKLKLGQSIISRRAALTHIAMKLVDDCSLTEARSDFLMAKDVNGVNNIAGQINKNKNDGIIEAIQDPHPVPAKGCGNRLKSGERNPWRKVADIAVFVVKVVMICEHALIYILKKWLVILAMNSSLGMASICSGKRFNLSRFKMPPIMRKRGWLLAGGIMLARERVY